MTKRSEKIRFKDGGENTDWQLKTNSISEYSRLVQIWKAGARRPSGCQLNIGKRNMKNNKTDFSQKYDSKKKLRRRKDRIQIEDLKWWMRLDHEGWDVSTDGTIIPFWWPPRLDTQSDANTKHIAGSYLISYSQSFVFSYPRNHLDLRNMASAGAFLQRLP